MKKIEYCCRKGVVIIYDNQIWIKMVYFVGHFERNLFRLYLLNVSLK